MCRGDCDAVHRQAIATLDLTGSCTAPGVLGYVLHCCSGGAARQAVGCVHVWPAGILSI